MSDSYSYVNKKNTRYYLNHIVSNNNDLYFFSRDQRPKTACGLPKGYVVLEVEKTGLPLLRKAVK